MMAASRDTVSQVFFVYVLAFLVPAGGHALVAGSSDVMVGVFAGEIPFWSTLAGS